MKSWTFDSEGSNFNEVQITDESLIDFGRIEKEDSSSLSLNEKAEGCLIILGSYQFKSQFSFILKGAVFHKYSSSESLDSICFHFSRIVPRSFFLSFYSLHHYFTILSSSSSSEEMSGRGLNVFPLMHSFSRQGDKVISWIDDLTFVSWFFMTWISSSIVVYYSQ